MSTGGFCNAVAYSVMSPTAGAYLSVPSIDYLGTGGGGGFSQPGVNGGGAGSTGGTSSFPAGGGSQTFPIGGPGLVIVEW
jgi:hypothetical protein